MVSQKDLLNIIARLIVQIDALLIETGRESHYGTRVFTVEDRTGGHMMGPLATMDVEGTITIRLES